MVDIKKLGINLLCFYRHLVKTTNYKIRSLVNDIAYTAQITFRDRCVAVYVMGSLARGGFSENASDIDIGIILDDPLFKNDAQCIQKIQSDASEKHSSVKNQVSIFWGSLTSINGINDAGRYPPFDRLDLIDHALLLIGEDVRAKLQRPSKKELEIAGAEFALEYLGSKEAIEELFDYETIIQKGSAHVSKTVLFPARFIYLEETGEIAGNDVSYQYYIDHFSGPDADLVKHGYQWRFDSLPDDVTQVSELLRNGLGNLYLRFIDIYVQQMDLYEEEDLKIKLMKWKESMTSQYSRTRLKPGR